MDFVLTVDENDASSSEGTEEEEEEEVTGTACIMYTVLSMH